MMDLTKEQKDLLKYIVQAKNNYSIKDLIFYKQIIKYLKLIAIEWETEPSTLRLFAYNEKSTETELFKIFDIVYFIKHLETLGYIYVQHLKSTRKNGALFDETKYERISVEDKVTYNSISKTGKLKYSPFPRPITKKFKIIYC